MPITSSAKKALRASKRKKVFNVRRKESVKNAVKEIKKLLEQGNKKETAQLLSKAQKAIDKAVKAGIIKKNTAARKKSRLVALIKRTS